LAARWQSPCGCTWAWTSHRSGSEAIALLDRVGIPQAAQRFDAYPHQFSGGQRQRITIAMALACGPDLLIADEPTTALDVTIQQQILDLISDLVAERNMALILISHDLGVISQNVDRMLVMYGGSVVESGPTASVFAAMAHPYTRGLLAARPQLAPRTAAARGWRPLQARCPSWWTCPLAARLPGAAPSPHRPATTPGLRPRWSPRMPMATTWCAACAPKPWCPPQPLPTL
jgi:peptide/nickel transport system ATP-binding protein